jgi:radical SAM-linked protein
MVRDKVRIRFRKAGDLRLVSHHDLMRCFERMLRRAELPYHSSQGFHPKPRLVFALSLPLGVVGHEEVVELELDRELPVDEIQALLERQAPAGLEITSVRRISKTTAHVRSMCYRVTLPSHLEGTALAQRIAALLCQTECLVERVKPERRTVDIRPFVRDLRLPPGALEIDLWVTPAGTARPDEVLRLLGLGELLEAGVVLERTHLELQDEPLGERSGEGVSAETESHRFSPPESSEGNS